MYLISLFSTEKFHLYVNRLKNQKQLSTLMSFTNDLAYGDVTELGINILMLFPIPMNYLFTIYFRFIRTHSKPDANVTIIHSISYCYPKGTDRKENDHGNSD
jgi:hypothetical protein